MVLWERGELPRRMNIRIRRSLRLRQDPFAGADDQHVSAGSKNRASNRKTATMTIRDTASAGRRLADQMPHEGLRILDTPGVHEQNALGGWDDCPKPCFQIALSVVIASSGVALLSEVAEAHCPGTNASGGRDYAADRLSLSSNANGVKAIIAWTNPAVCGNVSGSPFSLEGTTLCKTSSCPGWVQTGWVRFSSWSEPKMYCEFVESGGAGVKYFFPLTHVTHTFQMAYDSFDLVWDCFLDGAGKASRGGLGFAAGDYLNVQGEVNSTHSQIGLVAPSKLLFNSMRYRNTSGSWVVFNPNSAYVESPYGYDRPASDQFRNWTNAH